MPARENAGLVVAVSIPVDLPMLRADERKTQQVFLNLLSNAVKFTHPGGRIDVVAHFDPDTGLTIRVIDTGIGIEPQNLSVVFEPFMQIDSALSRQHDGTGLGLPVVKAIVQRHQGKVQLQSILGSGTEATVIFPSDRAIATQSRQTCTGYEERPWQVSI